MLFSNEVVFGEECRENRGQQSTCKGALSTIIVRLSSPLAYLSKVYCRAVARQNSAAPRTPQDIPKRALFRQPNGPCLANN